MLLRLQFAFPSVRSAVIECVERFTEIEGSRPLFRQSERPTTTTTRTLKSHSRAQDASDHRNKGRPPVVDIHSARSRINLATREKEKERETPTGCTRMQAQLEAIWNTCLRLPGELLRIFHSRLSQSESKGDVGPCCSE